MSESDDTPSVLCVDLDGTLIRTDMLVESALCLLKQRPEALLLLPFWFLSAGRAGMKRRIAEQVDLPYEHLPYNHDVVDHVKEQRRQGRRVVLATASDKKYADGVAAHLGVFDEVLASDGEVNMKGERKAALLVERFGTEGFEYIGDSQADLKVWKHSTKAHVVGRSENLAEKAAGVAEAGERFVPERGPFVLLRAFRIHQWVKNILLFVPIIMAHQLVDIVRLQHVFFGFISISFCASSVYLTNDLFDLNADRAHPTKRRRPLASGELPLAQGVLSAVGLLVASFSIALFLPPAFIGILSAYLAVTLAYSLFLKRIEVLDIIILASLYTVRIMAGGMAAEVTVSKWLLAFSMFFFLSLACIKRFSELFRLRKENRAEATGRGYRAADLEQIAAFGPASGYLSVLVLALYVNSTEVRALYTSPEILWFLCPVMLYWISRIWLLAHRGEVHEDPIVFAIRDKASYVVGAVSLLLLGLAM